MNRKMYWGVAILILSLICIAGVFLQFNCAPTETEVFYHVPADTSEPPAAEPGFKWVRNGDRWNKVPVEQNAGIDNPEAEDVNSHQTRIKTEFATEPVYDVSEKGTQYMRYIPRDPDRFAHLPEPPLPPSAVPEDCPEHLKLNPEWIDGVYHGTEPPPANDQFTEEVAGRMGNILLEIIDEHNPKRPYVEIWDQFIEYEKMYREYAEWELGFTPRTHGSSVRLDWTYEQTWAFPEFAELLIAEDDRPHGEENRFVAAYDVAMGRLDHGWNKITLKDGRDFFIKGNSRYEFSYSGVNEDGNEWESTTGFSRIRLTESTPVVRIDVSNTSDEALEAMMGWDYSINPITMRPLEHDSSHVPILPRILESD